ncbi:fork head domain-containing protein [Coprinopsis sp. MPI-PUGE-AT-0042]|nr:fork head domain-containing protein [Coprinopsis sp. MPI-PUGE-AT-0042]
MPVYRSPALQRVRLPSIYEGMLPGDDNNLQQPFMGGYSRQTPEHGQSTHDPRQGGQYQQISAGNSLLGSNMFGPNNYLPAPPGQYGAQSPEAGSRQDLFLANYNSQQHFSAASAMQPGYHDLGTNTNEYGVSQPPRSTATRSNSFPPGHRGTRNATQIALAPSVLTGSVSPHSGNAPLPEPEDWLRQKLNIPAGVPVDLWALPNTDPSRRPPYAYPLLVRLAIQGSKEKKLTLKEIYEEIENRFEYYRNNTNGAWKGSIRHNLSLNQVFRNVPRPLTEPGKGNYWEIDHSKGEGYKRDRKRRTRRKGAAKDESDDGVYSEEYTPSPELESMEMESGEGGMYTFHDSNPGPSNAVASTSRTGSSRGARRHSPYPSPEASSTLHPPHRPYSTTGVRGDEFGYDYGPVYQGGSPSDSYLFQDTDYVNLGSPRDEDPTYGSQGSYQSRSDGKRRASG